MVADAAVVGIPLPAGGEMVVAAVVATGTAWFRSILCVSTATRKVTRYKVPRRIVVVDDLPRSMLGKVLRRKGAGATECSGEFDQ